MDTLTQIATRIIQEQALIIGPLAWDEAKKVPGLKVNNNEVSLEGDKKQVVDQLVARYDRLFGRASHEVSRGAVASLLSALSPADFPASLKV